MEWQRTARKRASLPRRDAHGRPTFKHRPSDTNVRATPAGTAVPTLGDRRLCSRGRYPETEPRRGAGAFVQTSCGPLIRLRINDRSLSVRGCRDGHYPSPTRHSGQRRPDGDGRGRRDDPRDACTGNGSSWYRRLARGSQALPTRGIGDRHASSRSGGNSHQPQCSLRGTD